MQRMAVALSFTECGAQSREGPKLEGRRHPFCDRRRDPIGQEFKMLQGTSGAVCDFQAEHRPLAAWMG